METTLFGASFVTEEELQDCQTALFRYFPEVTCVVGTGASGVLTLHLRGAELVSVAAARSYVWGWTDGRTAERYRYTVVE